MIVPFIVVVWAGLFATLALFQIYRPPVTSHGRAGSPLSSYPPTL
jgi:hypothetical protein